MLCRPFCLVLKDLAHYVPYVYGVCIYLLLDTVASIVIFGGLKNPFTGSNDVKQVKLGFTKTSCVRLAQCIHLCDYFKAGIHSFLSRTKDCKIAVKKLFIFWACTLRGRDLSKKASHKTLPFMRSNTET